jgi:multiple sugar transport system substrate-binding protein
MWPPFKEHLGDDLVLLPMPRFGKQTVTGMGSWCWGITEESKNPEAAWEFLKFLMEPGHIFEMSSANGGIPSRKSALQLTQDYKTGGPVSLFAEQLIAGIAVPRPKTPAYPFISQVFAEATINIFSGADIEFQLNEAVKQIDSYILEKNLSLH